MCRWPCSSIDMDYFFRDLNEESTPSQMDMLRCPFLRNINEPTNFSFSPSMAFPMPVSCLLSILVPVFRNSFFMLMGLTWSVLDWKEFLFWSYLFVFNFISQTFRSQNHVSKPARFLPAYNYRPMPCVSQASCSTQTLIFFHDFSFSGSWNQRSHFWRWSQFWYGI